MKLKNTFLGIIALFVSGSAAFASLTAASPDFIHVRYQGDANFTCTVATTCSETGVDPCRAQIVVLGVSRTTPIYDVKNSPTLCSQQLMDDDDEPFPVTKERVIIAAD